MTKFSQLIGGLVRVKAHTRQDPRRRSKLGSRSFRRLNGVPVVNTVRSFRAASLPPRGMLTRSTDAQQLARRRRRHARQAGPY